MDDLRRKTLEFLHTWVNKNNIAGIRKGMVEELEGFILATAAEVEVGNVTKRMEAQKPVTTDAKPKEK